MLGQTVVIIAQQKGRDTKENIHRNFGMAHPSGYRKAIRMFDLADKFNFPIITLIDTPGAYPGITAEENGQAWTIAESIQRMSSLKVPSISIVIGEGGSGGALAIGVANRVLILENAIYSVISPESCAAILWRNANEAPKAAEALRLTANDLLGFKVVDKVIKEPFGGAHREPKIMMERLTEILIKELESLCKLSESELISSKQERFRKLGSFELTQAAKLEQEKALKQEKEQEKTLEQQTKEQVKVKKVKTQEKPKEEKRLLREEVLTHEVDTLRANLAT